MLRVLGPPTHACDRVTRREILRAGGLSLLGLSLPDLLRAEATLPQRPRAGRAKSVILLYLFGGPPQHDTFDPKPAAAEEIRGEFGSIPTSVPGVRFCELLPQTAHWMDRSSLIRSGTHVHNDHSAGLLYTMTGKKAAKLESRVPILPSQAPSMNSVIQYLSRHERRELPASVWMPCYTGWGQNSIRPGPYAGFLGRQFDPLFTSCKLEGDRKAADFYDAALAKGQVVLPDMQLPEEITLDRLDRRRSLLQQFDDELRRVERDPTVGRFDAYQQQAFDSLTSSNTPNSPWRAFSVEEEDPRLRERYGCHLYGESTLVARRLVERGVRFVTMTWECLERQGADPTGWDTHSKNFSILKNYRLPVLDQVFSALCEDLQDRGLLDETLVVVMGEMGRSPKVNKSAGRDHWSYCYDVLLTGAGVKHGMVFGASDRIGAYPARDPVGPEAIIATIYAAMGINTTAFIHDLAGRPQPVAQHGEPVQAVLA